MLMRLMRLMSLEKDPSTKIPTKYKPLATNKHLGRNAHNQKQRSSAQSPKVGSQEVHSLMDKSRLLQKSCKTLKAI